MKKKEKKGIKQDKGVPQTKKTEKEEDRKRGLIGIAPDLLH